MASSPAASKSKLTPTHKAQDVFQRLTHLVTGKHGSELAADTPLPPSGDVTSAASSSSMPQLHRSVSASSSLSKKRQKLAERLKKIGQDLGKFRPTSDNKSVPASPRITVALNDIPTITGSSPATDPSSSNIGAGHAKLLSMVAEVDEPAMPQEPSTSTVIDPPEPSTFVTRIEALIDALPFPTFNKVPNPEPPARDDDGRPIPPEEASQIKDSKLLGFLSSPTIMNGSTAKGKPSIWSILEGLMPPPHGFPRVGDDGAPESRGENEAPDVEGGSDQDTIFSDNSSLMIYSPLIPTNEDLVELAELVPVGVQEEPMPDTQSPIAGTSWTAVWPLSLWYTTPSTESRVEHHRSSGETVISPLRTSIDSSGRPVRVQTVRAWVPSNTKISVQAMWWGYRIYLPPPVLDILSDKTLEATKRAAMITTALTWFFNNLPISTLPAPVVPAALLLQRIAPFLGYIGTFISWSWSTIKSYDVGYGVILTATWLLPIALIPGTWHQYDFPTSPSQGSPAPLPPMSPSSQGEGIPLPDASTSVASRTAAMAYPTPQSVYATLPPTHGPTPVYPRVVVMVPVPPPHEDTAPVPPIPEDPPVPLGSPLMEQLLHGPLISTVPLPDEDAPAPPLEDTPRKRDARSRAKALFTRSSRSR